MFKRIFVLMGTVTLGLTILFGVLWLLMAPAQVARAGPPPPGCPVIDRDFDVITTLTGTCYHFVTDTVAILPGVVVTVAPPAGGTALYFNSNARVQVDGTFRALGQADRPITFTSALVNPTRDVWRGIIFVDGSDPLDDVIQYSTIEYALAAIQSGDEDYILILSNTFRYNGDGSGLAGAIVGDTDNSVIRNNVIYSNSNGIVLNESFGNQIISNVVHTIDYYGIHFAQGATQGGSDNTIQQNEIHRTGLAGGGGGLRLEGGSGNAVLSNSIYLNSGAAIYLLDQTLAEVRYNHVYENGGSGYPAGIYVTGTALMGAMSYNVISDTAAEAVEFDVGMGGIWQAPGNNALCSLPGMEWRNGGASIGDAPGNWWSTNVPLLGVNYTGFTTVTSPIVLSLITTTSDLPADGISTGVITISFRDASGRTVPPAASRLTNPPAPNPRRVELATTLGAINPSIVYVDDNGFAVVTLTSAPTIGTAIVTATAFCNYPISIPVRFAATNLAIAKTSAVTQVAAGDVITFRITYSNTSGVMANGVRITDTLPAGTTWLDDDAAALGWIRLQTSPQVVYSRASLAAGVQESFVLTAAVDGSACGASLTNGVAIGTQTLEDMYADNSASAGPVGVICADVTLAKRTVLAQAVPGALITYTIVYSNAGSATAYGVVITDVLPAGTRYWADTSGLPCPACVPGSTGPLVWSVPSPMPPNSSYNFNLMLQVDRNSALCGASLVNGVSIATLTPESNLSNNSAQAGPLSLVCADVFITKTTPFTGTVAGGLIDYTITYGNLGAAPAENAIITDTLPAGTRYVTSSLPCPACVPGATGPLTWGVGTLPPGSSYSFNLTLQVDPGTTNCNLVVPPNTVVITTTTPETNTANNAAASPSVLSVCPVDLVVIKDDDVGPTTMRGLAPGRQTAVDRLLRVARPLDPRAVTQHRDFVYEGDLITYTIAVVNVGTITATNVVLTETLPQYTSFVTGSGWTAITPLTYVLPIGSLAPGEGRVYYFVVRVNDPITGDVSSLINLVCGFGLESDANPADNCGYEDTPVRRQPLRISKWTQCMVPGKEFTYWVVYTNSTSATYFNVPITDTLPISATYTGDINDWICAGNLYCAWTAPVIYSGTISIKPLSVRLDGNYPYSTVTNTVVISDGRPFVLVTPIDTNPDLYVVKNDCIGPQSLEQQRAWKQIQHLLHVNTPSGCMPPYREFARPGERITYTIAYGNNGIVTATNVILTETLPANTAYVGGGWTWAGGRLYVLVLGDLPPHYGGELQFIVQVNDPFPCGSNRVVNRVDIGGGLSECDLTNNWSADHTPISGCTPIQIYLPIIIKQVETGPLPEVAFSRSNYYVWETMGVATITVVLNQPSAQTVMVNYATSDGTATAGLDYITSTGTLTFAPGATSATFTVQVLSDAVTETLETVNLTLSDPVNATIGQPHPATLTIVDPCPPTPPDCAPAIWCVIPSEFSPMGMAYDSAAGHLFVANQFGPSGGNLSIHQNDGLPLGTIDGLINPQGVALDNTRGRHLAYVAGANWLHIVELSATTPYVLATLEVGVGEDVGAYSVVYNPNTDLIYVTGYRDNSVTVIQAETWHILRRLTGFHEPSYTAVNTATNKVYVSNHTGGNPWGFVSVISGTDKIGTVYLSGDLYGISVDAVRNRIFVASISVARVYVIDGRTDTTMGDIQIIRSGSARPVPLRQAAVNPRVGTDTHLWLTSSSGDLHGMDRLILLSLPQSNWPPVTPLVLRSVAVAASPEEGLVFDPNPASWRVFASSAASDLVTVSQDNANLCPNPLAASGAGEDGYYVVTHDYHLRRPNR